EDARQLKGPPYTQLEDLIGRRIGDRPFLKAYLSAIDPFIASHHIEQRCFPRTIGSNQTGDGALFYADRTRIQGANASERFTDTLRFQQAHKLIPSFLVALAESPCPGREIGRASCRERVGQRV